MGFSLRPLICPSQHLPRPSPPTYAFEDSRRILEKEKLHFWSFIAVHANVNIHAEHKSV